MISREPRIKRILSLMVELQNRNMTTRQMSAELQITERTAYRYLKLFREHGIGLNQTKFGQYTFQKVETKKRPAKRIKNKMNTSNPNQVPNVGKMVKKTPIETIFERFQFHDDFPKWMAENKTELLKAEKQLLAKFCQWMCESQTNLDKSVELFLKENENH